MARWRPDARDRLEHAALELFLEHGFDDVTVPEIATRAGLTTRTFYRHFADKREVLFDDVDEIPTMAARLVSQAPPGIDPVAVVARGLPELAATAFAGRLELMRQRHTVVNSSSGLVERELRKMERLTDAIAAAFRQRGVDELTAAVVAEMAVGVVRTSLRHWIESGGGEDLGVLMTTTLRRLSSAFDDAHLPPDPVD